MYMFVYMFVRETYMWDIYVRHVRSTNITVIYEYNCNFLEDYYYLSLNLFVLDIAITILVTRNKSYYDMYQILYKYCIAADAYANKSM